MDVSEPKSAEPQLDIRSVLKLDEASHPKPSRRLLYWGAAILIVAAIAASVFVLWGDRPAVSYISEPVSRRDLTVIVNATGSVQPTNKVDISSELSGTVRRVFVDYNSKVKAGQPLAELDTDKLRATIENSRAKLGVARAQLAEAEATIVERKQDLERKQTLAARQVGTVQDLDTAKAAYDRALASRENARASINAAEADLHLNELNLSKAYIASPIDGVVLKRNVDPGQTVAVSLQAPVLFSIAEDLTQMEIQVDVDEADVGQVREGQSATFQVDAYPDRKFPATIRVVRYDSEVVQGVVTYKAVLSVNNSDLSLRPGMTATAAIVVNEVKDALVVPNAALRFVPAQRESSASRSLISRLTFSMPRFRPATPQQSTASNRTVWQLKETVPTAVPVTIGASDGKFTQIVSGDLSAGQAVIVDTAALRR